MLCAVTGGTAGLQRELSNALGGTWRVHDAKSGVVPAGAFCQVSSLNAATGMEAPIVFLIGAESLAERAAAPGLSSDERRERERDVARQLYMAFTRAGQRLVVVTHSRKLSDELRGLVG